VPRRQGEGGDLAGAVACLSLHQPDPDREPQVCWRLVSAREVLRRGLGRPPLRSRTLSKSAMRCIHHQVMLKVLLFRVLQVLAHHADEGHVRVYSTTGDVQHRCGV
jgi:hypothetical protein